KRRVAAVIEQEAASYDLAQGVYPGGVSKPRARHVKRGKAAIIEQERKRAEIKAKILSNDLARVVYAVGIGPGDEGRAGHVKRGKPVSRLGLSVSREAKQHPQSHQAAEIALHCESPSCDEKKKYFTANRTCYGGQVFGGLHVPLAARAANRRRA